MADKKSIGCSMIFYNSQNEILLLLRDNITTIKYPNLWNLIGGGSESGETPEECITRETEEEIEVKLEIGKFRLFKKIDHPDRTEYTFCSELNLESDHLNEYLHEGQLVRWFKEKDLPKGKIAWGHEPTIIEFFKKIDVR